MAKPMRTPEGIRESKQAEIHKRTGRNVVKRWSRTEALKMSALIFRSRWVVDPFKEKSRYATCEYATYKGPRVFETASDHNLSRFVELKSNTQACPTFLLHATMEYIRAIEDELGFFEAPPEGRGLHPYGGASRRSYGRGRGSTGWQELFHGSMTSEAMNKEGFPGKVFDQRPTAYYIEEADGVLELNVDHSHGTCKPKLMWRFACSTWRSTSS